MELIGFTSMTVPVSGYDETHADTDKAIITFHEQIADADPSVQEAFRDALAGLDQLECDPHTTSTRTPRRGPLSTSGSPTRSSSGTPT